MSILDDIQEAYLKLQPLIEEPRIIKIYFGSDEMLQEFKNLADVKDWESRMEGSGHGYMLSQIRALPWGNSVGGIPVLVSKFLAPNEVFAEDSEGVFYRIWPPLKRDSCKEEE